MILPPQTFHRNIYNLSINQFKIQIKMKTTKLTAVLADSYKSPEVSVAEISAEGVLCASTVGSTLSVEEWETGNFAW